MEDTLVLWKSRASAQINACNEVRSRGSLVTSPSSWALTQKALLFQRNQACYHGYLGLNGSHLEGNMALAHSLGGTSIVLVTAPREGGVDEKIFAAE